MKRKGAKGEKMGEGEGQTVQRKKRSAGKEEPKMPP
jgi:hypothetical protein